MRAAVGGRLGCDSQGGSGGTEVRVGRKWVMGEWTGCIGAGGRLKPGEGSLALSGEAVALLPVGKVGPEEGAELWRAEVASCGGGVGWLSATACSCGVWAAALLAVMCVSSLCRGGVCMSGAVGAGVAVDVAASAGSVLPVAGVDVVWPRTLCNCWEANSSDQRTSRV